MKKEKINETDESSLQENVGGVDEKSLESGHKKVKENVELAKKLIEQSKEKKIEEKIESGKAKHSKKIEFLEQKESKQELLKEALRLFEETEKKITEAEEKLSEAQVSLEEIEGLLNESINELEGEYGEKAQEILEETKEIIKAIEEEISTIKKEKENIELQINDLKQEIEELEKSIEELSKDPEVIDYLEKQNRQEEEIIGQAVENFKKNTKDDQKSIFDGLNKIADEDARRIVYKKDSEIYKKEFKKDAVSYLTQELSNKKGGDMSEINKEILNNLKDSISFRDFSEKLESLSEKYKGILNSSKRKNIEKVKEDSFGSSSDNIFKKWGKACDNYERWDKKDEKLQDTLEDLSVKYENLIRSAWELKRKYPNAKAVQNFPYQAGKVVEEMVKESIKEIDKDIAKNSKNSMYKDTGIEIKDKKKSSFDYFLRQVTAKGKKLMFTDPLETDKIDEEQNQKKNQAVEEKEEE